MIRLLIVVLFIVTAAFPALAADGPVLSGLLDTIVNLGAGAGEADDFSYGIEEVANLRMQTKIKDKGVFYGAFNLIAVSGTALGGMNAGTYPGLSTSALVAGENYAAALELERLYFRVTGEYLDVDTGLMRLAFGYGQVFGSSDFLNPRNPLFPDARPRGILGSAVSVYPTDTAKVLAFATAPKNPFNSNGNGFLFGLSGDKHWDKVSLQVLYAFETPQEASSFGIHRGGLSLKADVEVGLVADMLYTYNHETTEGIDGLSVGAGFDYSFYDGNFYVLAEYLFNGSTSATARSAGNPTGFANQHYLYAMLRYAFNDYTSTSLACIVSFEDISFAPILSVEHELFQGLTLSFSGRLPLDRDVFSGNGEWGELGPIPPGVEAGTRFLFTAKARLRF
ncbi:MAG: hypothetical protein LBU17_03675 [Treponema sp.]|jgi:hypothetical protein|nr:hypothetical protein [Treponema sp.]